MRKHTKLLCANCKKRLDSTESLALQEVPITKGEAKRLGLIPLSSPLENNKDYWILDEMIKDVKRQGKNFALVKEQAGVSLYHSTSSFKEKIKR